MQLSKNQQRIIGCLLEKQSITPEHYPLSLNALTNACNQKTNRNPVLALSENDILTALDELMTLRLVTLEEGFSGRVNKYNHRFCNTEFSDLLFTEQQRAIICSLLLRGAQTPGELKAHGNRLANFSNVRDVEETLHQLMEQQHVKKLQREPGKRESRYHHLFADQQLNTDIKEEKIDLKNDELHELLAEIDELKAELRQIKSHLGL